MNEQPARPGVRQVLLGTFIVLELAMMFLENGFAVLERSFPYELQGMALHLRTLSRNYTRLTAQPQNWSMFAPPPEHGAFPIVELYEQGAARPYATLMDPLRQEDLDAYFLPYGPGDRLCRYQAEMMLVVLLVEMPGLMEERPIDCRNFLGDKVREQWRMIRAYMQWRLKEAGPMKEPDSMILAAQVYPVPRLGEAWRWGEPYRRPYAQWDRSLEGSTEWLPILAWDPLEKRFRKLPIDGPLNWD